jgi:hypothetical protein
VQINPEVMQCRKRNDCEENKFPKCFVFHTTNTL